MSIVPTEDNRSNSITRNATRTRTEHLSKAVHRFWPRRPGARRGAWRHPQGPESSAQSSWAPWARASAQHSTHQQRQTEPTMRRYIGTVWVHYRDRPRDRTTARTEEIKRSCEHITVTAINRNRSQQILPSCDSTQRDTNQMLSRGITLSILRLANKFQPPRLLLPQRKHQSWQRSGLAAPTYFGSRGQDALRAVARQPHDARQRLSAVQQSLRGRTLKTASAPSQIALRVIPRAQLAHEPIGCMLIGALTHG